MGLSMASPESPVPLELLLQTLQREVEQASLRRVSVDLGRSPNAIRNLLAGARPNTSTVQKLNAWFLKLSRPPELSPAAAQAALDLLTQGFPETDQIGVSFAVLELVRERHRKNGTPHPEWIEVLEESLRKRDLG